MARFGGLRSFFKDPGKGRLNETDQQDPEIRIGRHYCDGPDIDGCACGCRRKECPGRASVLGEIRLAPRRKAGSRCQNPPLDAGAQAPGREYRPTWQRIIHLFAIRIWEKIALLYALIACRQVRIPATFRPCTVDFHAEVTRAFHRELAHL